MLLVERFGRCRQQIVALRGEPGSTISTPGTTYRPARPSRLLPWMTGSNIPRHVGRPVSASLAASDPYLHSEDADRELGVTTPATR